MIWYWKILKKLPFLGGFLRLLMGPYLFFFTPLSFLFCVKMETSFWWSLHLSKIIFWKHYLESCCQTLSIVTLMQKASYSLMFWFSFLSRNDQLGMNNTQTITHKWIPQQTSLKVRPFSKNLTRAWKIIHNKLEAGGSIRGPSSWFN